MGIGQGSGLRSLAFWGLVAAASCAPGGPLTRSVDVLSPMQIPTNVAAVAPELMAETGRAKFRAGAYGEAVAYFQQAAVAYPQDPSVWLGLAASADRAGQFAVSAEAYAALERLTGQGFEYLNNIGFSYILQGRYRQAEEALDRALTLRPGNPTAMNNKALLESIRG